MSKLARAFAVTAGAAVLTGGLFAPSASAASHPYTCINQGVGASHIVYCYGAITVNNALDYTTVTVHDINLLSGTQLSTLQNVLTDVSDNDVNLSAAVQLADLQTAVENTYLIDFRVLVVPVNVTVCDANICV